MGRTPQTIRRYIKQINTREANPEELACKETDDLPVNPAKTKASPNAAKAHPEPVQPSTDPSSDPGADANDADVPLPVKHDQLAPDHVEEGLAEFNTDEVTEAEADFDLAVAELARLLAELPEDCREAHAEATILLIKAFSDLTPDQVETAIDHLQVGLNGLLTRDLEPNPTSGQPAEQIAS